MGKINDRNGKDLTEAEEIKKRWQEYTELYKKCLNDLDNHDGLIPHLEPDILENEASGGDGIPIELLKILRDDAMEVLH